MIVNLPKGAILSIDLDRQKCLAQCREGKIWITMSGDIQDYCLAPGDETLLSNPGKVVIEAVTDACVAVFDSSADLTESLDEKTTPPAHGSWLHMLHRMLHALRPHATSHSHILMSYSEPPRS